MFEHFGIRDVLSSIKKYRLIILIFLSLSVVFGAYRGLNKLMHQSSSAVNDPAHSFEVSSASYMINPKIKLDKDNTNIYRDVPSQTAAVLMTDFCKKYVFEGITNIYSNEEIFKNISYLDTEYEKPSDLDFEFLDDLFFSSQYENTMIIKLTAESHDSQFTKDVLNLYREYLEKEYAPTVNDNVDISYIDTVDQAVNSDKSVVAALIEESKDSNAASSTKKTSTSLNPVKVMIKSIAIPFIIAVTLCLIVIFLITLFNPTLNRETDFLAYDIPVIGEIYVHKKPKEDE